MNKADLRKRANKLSFKLEQQGREFRLVGGRLNSAWIDLETLDKLLTEQEGVMEGNPNLTWDGIRHWRISPLPLKEVAA